MAPLTGKRRMRGNPVNIEENYECPVNRGKKELQVSPLMAREMNDR
jgi:hypothetical protein